MKFKHPISKTIGILVVLGLLLSQAMSAAFAQGGPPANGPALAQGTASSRSGWFSITWGDDANGAPAEFYTLTDDSGQTISLRLGETLIRSLGGVLPLNRRYVTVQGAWSSLPSGRESASFVVTSLVPRPDPDRDVRGGGGGGGGGGIPPVVGSQPWISIMCKFPDQVIEPNNIAYFQNMYSSVQPGLDHYWREVSYNIANVVGSTAVGWFVLPHPLSYYNPGYVPQGTDLSLLADDCIAAADPSLDFSPFIGINMMFNYDFDNGWAWGGSRYYALDGPAKFWSVTWEPPWAYSDISVIEHEMGHGFGLPHSSHNPVAVYDNVWDVMSMDRYNCPLFADPTYGCMAQHTISYHKDMLGWIDPAKKFTAAPGTTTSITMERLALPTNSNYLLAQIPINGTDTHFYTVEVRMLNGYDSKLPGAAVVIHDVDKSHLSGIPAYLIDTDGNGDTADAGAMFIVGETFSDVTNNIQVTVDSSTASGFVVTIHNGSADITPPVLSLPGDFSVPQTIPAGAVVTFVTSATDVIGPPNPVVTCTPPSGATFPVGLTTVNCSATDTAGNVGNGSFNVTVNAATNLLKKPDFASATVFPSPWQAFGFKPPYAAALDCNFFNFSSCSVLFPAGNRSAMQRVVHSGLAGDMYSFGMYSAANNAPAGGKYLVEVAFYNNFNRRVGLAQLQFSLGTHGFELVSGPAVAIGNYNKITFRFYYQNPSGRAWFDDGFLYALP